MIISCLSIDFHFVIEKVFIYLSQSNTFNYKKMKRLSISFALLLATILISCGEAESTDNNESQNNKDTVNTEGMSDLSLKEHGLELIIKTPAISSSTGSIIPSVTHVDGTLDWYVKIGDKFSLTIEEWSKEHKPSQKVAEEKRYVNASVFEIEYIIDEPNMIMYKRNLPEGQGGKPSYHVYSAQTIDEKVFVFKSGLDGGLKPVIEDMVKTILTVKSTDDQPA